MITDQEFLELKGRVIMLENLFGGIQIKDPDKFAERILTRVSIEFGVPIPLMISPNRSEKVAEARMVCMYLLFQEGRTSFREIGRIFNRDHSTALKAKQTIIDRMEAYPAFRDRVEGLLK